MKLEPPALPPPLVDESDDRIMSVESTWDALARAAIVETHVGFDERVRVKWKRYSLVHWCCWHRMRIGRCEAQKQHLTFGWKQDTFSFAACGRCGRIVDHVMF